MKLSCIMTTYDDGPILEQSVRSVLNQTYETFELLIVDDGSGPVTKDILSRLEDPRITVLPQANDGLSSARNRALQHASGEYICFLDADDTRAPWAFADVARCIEYTGAELIVVRGGFSGERTPLVPFLDEGNMLAHDEAAQAGPLTLSQTKAYALASEPQSANKFVARAVLERGALGFPNDHFFEDILFHAMSIAHARSVEMLPSRSFTYFQRQLREQLTASNGMIRFDIIGSVQATLDLFEQRPEFGEAALRGALSIGVLRLLRWCEETVPYYHRQAYRQALASALRQVNPLFLVIEDSVPDTRNERDGLMRYVRELM